MLWVNLGMGWDSFLVAYINIKFLLQAAYAWWSTAVLRHDRWELHTTSFTFLHGVFVLWVNYPKQGIGQPGTYIAAVSPSCELDHILSAVAFAEVHRGAEHPVCLVFFCLPHSSTGRILLYIFPLLLWNWITALMIVFNSWKCWGYPIAEVSYFKHHMPGKVCGIPPA